MDKIFKNPFATMQKVTVATLCVICMLFSWSCQSNMDGQPDIHEIDEVPYKPCPCGEEEPFYEKQFFSKGEVYLFKDSIPVQKDNQMSNKIHSAPFPMVCCIVYDSETDAASISIANSCLDRKSGCIMVRGLICNFPDFAKEWVIPENGCRVDIEGLIYSGSCEPHYAYYIPINCMLTKLKRK